MSVDISALIKNVLGNVPVVRTGPPKPMGTPVLPEPEVESEVTAEVMAVAEPEPLPIHDPAGPIPIPPAPPKAPGALVVTSLEDDYVEDTTAAVADVKPRRKGVTKTVREKPVVLSLPTFTPSEVTATLDLRSFATLASMSTSRWNAKTKDRTIAKEAETANGAQVGAFEAYKKLLAGNEGPLKKITAALDGARTKHYAMTLPWTTVGVGDEAKRTGARLLPNTLWMEYVKVMALYKGQMEKALDEFEPLYPDLIEKAKTSLGKRFDITEFPTPAEIRNKFDLSFSFDPVPQGTDFRGSGLLPDQIDRLSQALQEKTELMLENAMKDVWARLRNIMTRMDDRLSDPENVFHASMIDGVRELVGLMGHLNVTNDRRINELREYIDENIAPFDAEELRNKAVLRAQVHAAVVNVLNKMKELDS